ncbi:hypothetical protein C3L55_03320 [Veillonellaceae bacterium M1-70]|nr:hypothetical protein [Veillonellaceae bacterium M1-70]
MFFRYREPTGLEVGTKARVSAPEWQMMNLTGVARYCDKSRLKSKLGGNAGESSRPWYGDESFFLERMGKDAAGS